MRGIASTTKKEYPQRANNFVAYYHRPPTELRGREIRELLLYLVNDKKAGFAIDRAFRANQIVIPVPPGEVHVRPA